MANKKDFFDILGEVIINFAEKIDDQSSEFFNSLEAISNKASSVVMNSVVGTNKEGVTPIQLAVFNCKYNLLKKLLESGANPNQLTTEAKFSSMHVLADCKNQEIASEMAKLLLNYGGRLDQKKGDGQTVHEYLESLNKTTLLETVNSYRIDYKNHKPIHDLTLSNDLDIVNFRFIMNNKNYDSLADAMLKYHLTPTKIHDWGVENGYSDVVDSYDYQVINEIYEIHNDYVYHHYQV